MVERRHITTLTARLHMARQKEQLFGMNRQRREMDKGARAERITLLVCDVIIALCVVGLVAILLTKLVILIAWGIALCVSA